MLPRHVLQRLFPLVVIFLKEGQALPIEDLFQRQVKVINIGLQEFYSALVAQGVEAVHVDWRPPAQGDQEMLDLLDKLL
jgi:hypothetical protein